MIIGVNKYIAKILPTLTSKKKKEEQRILKILIDIVNDHIKRGELIIPVMRLTYSDKFVCIQTLIEKIEIAGWTVRYVGYNWNAELRLSHTESVE